MKKKSIILLKAYGVHPIGASLTLGSPIADLLIGRKVAREDKPSPKPKQQSKKAHDPLF
jgi:hypothetical protein